MTAPPAVDVSVLDALIAQLGESGEMMRRILLETYLSEGAQRMADLRRAVAAHDALAIRGLAHTTKSSSSLLGMTALAALLQRIEDAARAGAHDVAPQAGLVEAEYVRVEQAVAGLLAALPDESPAATPVGHR